MLIVQVDYRGRQGSKAGCNLYTCQSMQVTHQQRWLLIICFVGVRQANVIIDWRQKFPRLLQTEQKPWTRPSTEHFSQFQKKGDKSLIFTKIDPTLKILLYGEDLIPFHCHHWAWDWKCDPRHIGRSFLSRCWQFQRSLSGWQLWTSATQVS